MEILALIPARGGSKRIPNKNIEKLNGIPLIVYTIQSAASAKHVSRIVVSTNEKEIASVAKRHGAEVPFMRPNSISGSDSTEMEFFTHALDWFKENEDYEPDLIVLLYPTSPLRKPDSIDKAIEQMLKNPKADSLRSVKLCSEHPYKMWVIEDVNLRPFINCEDPNIHTFSYHLLPAVFIQNASIYITKPSTIKLKNSIIGDSVIPFIMDEVESIDINTYLDFKFAEMVIKDL